MVTTTIQVKAHLAEYAKSLYNVPGKPYIQIPHHHDLYHLMSCLMKKRPQNASITKGNLEIALPAQSRGKDPLTYNYISARGVQIFEEKLETFFWAHVHDFVDDHHHRFGVQMKEAIYMFMLKFKITSITEDALSKNYYRWRQNVRRRRKKRRYSKNN